MLAEGVKVDDSQGNALSTVAGILSKGEIGRGSNIILIPSFYGHNEVGNAARELEARLTFVDIDDRGILNEIQGLFPEFERVTADALTFSRAGVAATVNYRTEFQYIHHKRVLAPGHVIYGPGYERFVSNLGEWSPLHFLFSKKKYYDGDRPRQFSTAADADRAIMQQYGFRLKEEGEYSGDAGVMRWHLFENTAASSLKVQAVR